MDFDTAVAKVIAREGGFVDHPLDRGGPTKFGISRRAYPYEDIENLTTERAAELYRRDYWGPAGCDAMPGAVKLSVFDVAVNSGVKTAIRLAQKACGEVQDGILGPRTLQAIQSMHPSEFKARLAAARIQMLADLPSWPAFSRGWMKRIAADLTETA